jgi:hypothetical protein
VGRPIGEAERGRKAEAATVERGTVVQFTDNVGTRRFARRAPSVRAITAAHEDLICREDRAGERAEAQVPCARCTVCCHCVEVDRTRERAEELVVVPRGYHPPGRDSREMARGFVHH